MLRDGRTVQEAFDGLNGSLTLADIRSLTFTKVGEEMTIGEHTAGQGMGGGTFRVVSLTPAGYTDDNGCQIITNSGQSGRAPISLLQQIWDSCVRSSPDAINNSLNRAYPCIRPRGMKMKFEGTFEMGSTQNGVTIPLGNLLPGMRLMVTLHSWNADKWQLKVTKYDVQVMSIDYPCVITPVFGVGPTVTPTATTVSTPDGTTQALTAVAVSHNDRIQNGSLGSFSLRLNNGRPDNSTSYAVGSGLKLFVELPGDPSATVAKNYSVEIEIQ